MNIMYLLLECFFSCSDFFSGIFSRSSSNNICFYQNIFFLRILFFVARTFSIFVETVGLDEGNNDGLLKDCMKKNRK